MLIWCVNFQAIMFNNSNFDKNKFFLLFLPYKKKLNFLYTIIIDRVTTQRCKLIFKNRIISNTLFLNTTRSIKNY